MIDYTYRDLFHAGSIEKRLFIRYSGGTLENEDVASDTIELTECLCEEEELRFGSCCSSQFKIVGINYGNCLVGQKISVWMDLAGAEQSFPLGVYSVVTDKESSDGQYRNIVAYDALYGILKTNMADWYNSLSFPMTLRDFRDAFFGHFNIAQELTELTNDTMIVEKTIDPSEISGKDVLASICEINGCFGRINRQGNFQYVVLQENMEGLYPTDDLYPADDLFPRDKNFAELAEGEYFTCLYEKLVSRRITKLQIRQEEHDVGITVGEGDNGYVVEDNFLVYGKGTEDLTTIANNLLAVVGLASYQPYSLEAVGDPCIEPGDCIRISVDGGWIESYVLKRVLKGIQMLDDTYSAAGKEYHSDNAGSMAKKIKQLKGKMNKIEHTIEMTRLEITDLERGLSSRITQTADQISAEAKRAIGQEVELAAALSIQADRISSEVTRAQQAEQSLSGSLDSVNTILSSRITQTADQITAEVTRAKGQEVELAAAISIQANQIGLKVSKGEVSSQLSIESGQVVLKSNRFVLEATNCSISADGKITAKEVDITGKINAIEGGKIGGFTIGETSLYNKKTSFASNNDGVYIGVDGIAVGAHAFSVSKDGTISLGFENDIITKGSINFQSSLYSKIKRYGVTVLDFSQSYLQIAAPLVFTDTLSYIRHGYGGGTDMIKLSHNKCEIVASDSLVGISGGNVGFFGKIGSSRITVSKASTDSSVTASAVASTVNNLIDALKAYNLIG